MQEVKQPQINIGLVGHVDHGKTTLLERLSGKWAAVHSEELKRGITIRLGYADTNFYICKNCNFYTRFPKCPKCGKETKFLRKVSFVDAPGHETLMATMLSGAALMDCALLLIAADEPCPQPQTEEHLIALSILGVKEIVIVQNKVDLVSKEEAIKHYNQIKEFVKGTVAEKAPIIPCSAKYNLNIDAVIEALCQIPMPKRNPEATPIMFVVRSFDINKPGTLIVKLAGGVLGGAIKQGILKVGDKIEIKPGLREEKHGSITYKPLVTEIVEIHTGNIAIEKATAGGTVAIQTKLDPSFVKADNLAGNLVSHVGKLPELLNEIELEVHLLERVVGTKSRKPVEPIQKNEPLMLNVNSAVTLGIVTQISGNKVKMVLKRPICATKQDRFAISRRVEARWHLIGYGILV